MDKFAIITSHEGVPGASAAAEPGGLEQQGDELAELEHHAGPDLSLCEHLQPMVASHSELKTLLDNPSTELQYHIHPYPYNEHFSRIRRSQSCAMMNGG